MSISMERLRDWCVPSDELFREHEQMVKRVRGWVLSPVPYEVLQRAVVAPLALRGEETTGNLALVPVIKYALAAVAMLVAGGICACAMFDAF
jgi:hypothetical protein